MTNAAAIKRGIDLVATQEYDRSAYFHDVAQIVAHLNNVSLNELYIMQKHPINFDFKVLEGILNKYKQGVPLAYLLHKTWFYNLLIHVDQNAFIPRPETEQLVTEAINYIDSHKLNAGGVIFEIGTGSGAVSLAVGNALPHTQVYGSDISTGCLKVAQNNQKLLKLNNVSFLEGNLVEPFQKINTKCDVLLFNPPYIKPGDPDVDWRVIKYEPKIAVFCEDNLAFYTTYLPRYFAICKPQAMLVFEIGHNMQSAIANFLENSKYRNYKYHFKKDINGLWRNFIIFNC